MMNDPTKQKKMLAVIFVKMLAVIFVAFNFILKQKN